MSIATPAFSDPVIAKVDDHAQLNKVVCAAKNLANYIIILPASLFVDSRELLCATGTYKIYRIIPVDDPDDFDYFIDPPYGSEKRLACDGRAGRTMDVIAVNCRVE